MYGSTGLEPPSHTKGKKEKKNETELKQKQTQCIRVTPEFIIINSLELSLYRRM